MKVFDFNTIEEYVAAMKKAGKKFLNKVSKDE